ncbi:MAG: endonuclease MutS2 [Spirochaetota bacterium]
MNNTETLIHENERTLLEWDDVISLFCAYCTSDGAKALYRNLTPCTVQEANIRGTRIGELKEAIIRDDTPDFSPLFPVEKDLSYASKGGVLPLEALYRIGRSCTTTGNLIRYFSTNRDLFPVTMPLAASISDVSPLAKVITQSITDDIKLDIRFYPHIGRLQQQITTLEQEIQAKLSSMVHTQELRDHLQESIVTTRSEKYVVLIKSSAKGKTAGSIIDTSASGATYYFEPASVAPLNSKLLHLKNDLNRELHAVLRDLSHQAGSYADEIAENLRCAYRLDFLYACARLSIRYNYSRVTLTDDYTLNLYSARHPLLEADDTIDVVPNTVQLDAEHGGIIISGANTGGKTILLKTVALAVLLARYGLHAPVAPDSHVGAFRKIMVDIGDDQSIKQSLSTFSGQIVSVNRMIEEASPETLLIIDEIISGTNPRHAAALAMAILAHFSIRKARVIVSTHYPELKEYAHRDGYYLNASVSFNTETLKPTYRLLTGTPGTSYAFEIAKNYGMSASILSRAEQFLTQNEIVSDRTIEQVNRLEHELEEKRAELDRRLASLEKQRDNYYELNRKLRMRIQSAKEESALGIVETVEHLREEITKRLSHTKELSESEAQRMLATLDGHADNARESARKFKETRFSGEYLPFDEARARPGMKVFVVPLEKRGVIDSIDTRKKEALITLGALKSRYGFDRLRMTDDMPYEEEITPQKARSAEVTAAQPHGDAPEAELTIQTSDNTADLRGMRVDEAIVHLDRQLDQFIRRGLHAAVIIHGHGTGALKNAVRDHLRKQQFIRSVRPGEQGEGGDGVSIVTL